MIVLFCLEYKTDSEHHTFLAASPRGYGHLKQLSLKKKKNEVESA